MTSTHLIIPVPSKPNLRKNDKVLKIGGEFDKVATIVNRAPSVNHQQHPNNTNWIQRTSFDLLDKSFRCSSFKYLILFFFLMSDNYFLPTSEHRRGIENDPGMECLQIDHFPAIGSEGQCTFMIFPEIIL